jgi:hypothetical protein
MRADFKIISKSPDLIIVEARPEAGRLFKRNVESAPNSMALQQSCQPQVENVAIIPRCDNDAFGSFWHQTFFLKLE